MSKLLIQIFTICILIFSFSYIYINHNHYFDIIEQRLYDLMFLYRGEINTSQEVTIVDIDEKSLKKLGQWPWERDKISQIIDNLHEAQVGIIGLDIVFSEEDKSSPIKIFNKFNVDVNDSLKINYDMILSNSFKKSSVVGGFIFDMTENKNQENFVYINSNKNVLTTSKPNNFIKTATDIIPNIPVLNNSLYSNGYFNVVPDSDGIVRRVPLYLQYQSLKNGRKMLYPLLSFEMYRIANKINKVNIILDEEDNTGIRYIELKNDHNLTQTISTDMNGRLIINFRGKQRKFPYISALDIYNNTFDKNLIKNKYVLIGTSAPGIFDLRNTPYEQAYPGVEVHANIIDNLILQNNLYKPGWIEMGGVTIIIFILLILFIALITIFISHIYAFIIMLTLFSSVIVIQYYYWLNEGLILNLTFPLLVIITSYILMTLINLFFETKQKQLIKDKFSKKVSSSVVDDLMKSNNNVMEGKEKEITIFFSDVRSFTTISEKMGSAKKLIDLLNQYMTPMVDIIMKHEGTIDKFIGDAIMAYWNAPNDILNHCDKAVQASLEQIKALQKLNIILKEENKPLIDIGIGLNTGVSVVGEMGSDGRSDYTVIGDPVNLASRLEGLCKPYGVKIIISEFTYNKLQEKELYCIRPLDNVKVKGKEKPVKIYEVIDFQKDCQKSQEELNLYQKAFNLYMEENFEKSLQLFNELKEINNDKLYSIFIERCKNFIKNPPLKFDGTYTFTEK